MFEILSSTRANKEFTNLNEKTKKQIIEILNILSLDPIPAKIYDVKKLSSLRNTFRIRIGKFRLVYIVDWENKSIIIARIGFRESIYY